MAQRKEPGQVAVFLGPAAARRAAGAVEEFPEEVRGVRVRVAGCGCAQARVDADEDADEVRLEGVDELVCNVRVFARGCVA